MKSSLMNGAPQPGPTMSTKTFNIEQGFTATVISDFKHYRVMLKCGAWTYGPAVCEIAVAAKKLGGKDVDETKRLLAYAVKTQALKELSNAVMSGGGYNQNAPKPEPVNG